MRDFFSEKADIIVVDDEPLNRKIVSKMLKGRFIIREAASGEEALQMVKEKKPDLILLDVHMPEMNGHDVINILKSNSDTFDIPVVFVTADDDRETEANGLMEGADDFITKPFRQDILIQRISRIIELHFLQTNLKEEVARQTAKAEERSRKIEQMSLQTIHQQIEECFALPKQDLRTATPLTLAFVGDNVYDLIIRTILYEQGNRKLNSMHKQKRVPVGTLFCYGLTAKGFSPAFTPVFISLTFRISLSTWPRSIGFAT